jgi:hypothetical protein
MENNEKNNINKIDLDQRRFKIGRLKGVRILSSLGNPIEDKMERPKGVPF